MLEGRGEAKDGALVHPDPCGKFRDAQWLTTLLERRQCRERGISRLNPRLLGTAIRRLHLLHPSCDGITKSSMG